MTAELARETGEALAVRARRLVKLYSRGGQQVRALDGVDLNVAYGEFLAIMGTSGSGKSTLMNIMGALDTPTSGTVEIAGQNLASLNKGALARLRNRTIGFVFQQFNLLARATALEQVMLPLTYRDTPPPLAMRLAREQLERVGLGNRLDHTPAELSGGQQQRVAIARALVTEPAFILADEPTGALDTATTAEIMDLFAELNRGGMTIVLITHDEGVGKAAERIVRIQDGRIVDPEQDIRRRSVRLVS